MTTTSSAPRGAADGAAAPLLSLRGVNKSFGAVHVLQGVDLDAYAGQVTALVGDNGAGKSTLIKGIAGIYAFDDGEYRLRRPAGHRHQPQAGQRPGHRGRLPGPRAVRQPRHRPQPVPRPRDHQGRRARRGRDGEARRRDARRPVGPHREVDPAAGRQPVRRPAADRRHRPLRHLEQQGRHPRRADRRARRRADRAGAQARPPARGQRPRRHPHQPQPQRRLPGRRQHLRALPGQDGRPGEDEGRPLQPGGGAHHLRALRRHRPAPASRCPRTRPPSSPPPR